MTAAELRRAYEQLHAEGFRLAGGLTDLAQRAAVYHHITRDSGGNHLFPLIAAHGALWARGYFGFGLRLGRLLSWQYGLAPDIRAAQLASLDRFADAFRDINRRVCVDTYANYHFTLRHGRHEAAAEMIPPTLLDALNRVHAARRAGTTLPASERRAVFEAHFFHEQETVVAERIGAAVEAFDWPLVKFIALRPLIRFAYFPRGEFFWFRNFASKAERIERGLQAFEFAMSAGVPAVEAALRHYAVLPPAFFEGPVEYFADLRAGILAAV